MPVQHENSKVNFADLAAFKEHAVNMINRTYGRVKPYDIFDFSQTKDGYKCVAYREDEDGIPEEQKEGDLVSDEAAKSAEEAAESEEAEKAKAEAEVLAQTERITNLLSLGVELSEEDHALAVSLELLELPDFKEGYSLDEVLNASDAAMKLAAEHGIDLKLVKGTGAEGNITKPDVVKYIELNTAPDKDNADATNNDSQ